MGINALMFLACCQPDGNRVSIFFVAQFPTIRPISKIPPNSSQKLPCMSYFASQQISNHIPRHNENHKVNVKNHSGKPLSVSSDK
jgi:hypothetical protein